MWRSSSTIVLLLHTHQCTVLRYCFSRQCRALLYTLICGAISPQRCHSWWSNWRVCEFLLSRLRWSRPSSTEELLWDLSLEGGGPGGLLLFQTQLKPAGCWGQALHTSSHTSPTKAQWLISSPRFCCHFTENDAASVKLDTTGLTRPWLLVTEPLAPTPQLLMAKAGTSSNCLRKKSKYSPRHLCITHWYMCPREKRNQTKKTT